MAALALPAVPSQVVTSAAVAYTHYLSFMVCFAALVLERRLIRPNPERGEAVAMVIKIGRAHV